MMMTCIILIHQGFLKIMSVSSSKHHDLPSNYLNQSGFPLRSLPLVGRLSWIPSWTSGRRLCRARSSRPRATLQSKSRWTSPLWPGPVYSWTNGLRCLCSWRSSPSMWAFSCEQTSCTDGGEGLMKSLREQEELQTEPTLINICTWTTGEMTRCDVITRLQSGCLVSQ